MKKKNGNANRNLIIVAVLIMVVVGYYCYLVNRSNEDAQNDDLTPVQEVLIRDLDNNYPPTPKEVIKYYNEIMKCYYNEDCSFEEIEDLGQKARELYDDELLEHNEWGTYIITLTAEINAFKEAEKKLTSCSVAASTDVDFFDADGYSFARISCGYTVLKGKTSNSTLQIYLLRKDENGHWKIYGWDLAENVNLDNTEDTTEN